MKKALAVISFGTSYQKAREAIAGLEKNLAARLPDYDFYRAFTSQMVINKIERVEGIRTPNPGELMELLAQKGYGEVVCQSLHVIPGTEYEKMCGQLMEYGGRFKKLTVGLPMLWGTEDYRACVNALGRVLPRLGDDEAVVYMGHGSEHPMNAAYSQLENMFRDEGFERVYVGTVEGFPELKYICSRLKKNRIKKVYLYPMMITAGDHAQNDMAGDEDSWKSHLTAQGYETEVSLMGLGEIPEIADIFAGHLAVR